MLRKDPRSSSCLTRIFNSGGQNLKLIIFAALIGGGEDYYCKIDYYDRNLEFHSPDPADPEVTVRVHTSLDCATQSEFTEETTNYLFDLNQFQWKSYCGVLCQLPVAA